MSECAFCGRDMYERVDVGMGTVPVAVTCCEVAAELDAALRHHRETVTLNVGDLFDIQTQLATSKREAPVQRVEELEAGLKTAALDLDAAASILNGAQLNTGRDLVREAATRARAVLDSKGSTTS